MPFLDTVEKHANLGYLLKDRFFKILKNLKISREIKIGARNFCIQQPFNTKGGKFFIGDGICCMLHVILVFFGILCLLNFYPVFISIPPCVKGYEPRKQIFFSLVIYHLRPPRLISLLLLPFLLAITSEEKTPCFSRDALIGMLVIGCLFGISIILADIVNASSHNRDTSSVPRWILLIKDYLYIFTIMVPFLWIVFPDRINNYDVVINGRICYVLFVSAGFVSLLLYFNFGMLEEDMLRNWSYIKNSLFKQNLLYAIAKINVLIPTVCSVSTWFILCKPSERLLSGCFNKVCLFRQYSIILPTILCIAFFLFYILTEVMVLAHKQKLFEQKFLKNQITNVAELN